MFALVSYPVVIRGIEFRRYEVEKFNPSKDYSGRTPHLIGKFDDEAVAISRRNRAEQSERDAVILTFGSLGT